MSAKLGSVPWVIKTGLKKTLIMGSDVFHHRKKNSVASV